MYEKLKFASEVLWGVIIPDDVRVAIEDALKETSKALHCINELEKFLEFVHPWGVETRAKEDLAKLRELVED